MRSEEIQALGGEVWGEAGDLRRDLLRTAVVGAEARMRVNLSGL